MEEQDNRFARAMAKFNTLDRGTYFINETNKYAHFLVLGRSDLLGWYDTFIINGYLLQGVVIKITTLTSRIFVFIEEVNELFKKYIKIGEDGETAKWSEEMPDKT